MANNLRHSTSSTTVVINCYSEGYARFLFVFVADISLKLTLVMICNNSRDILESAALSNSTKNLQGPIESCAQSPIRQNVTLRGGINAGSFKKLAQFVAMQLCIRLCCEEKGCDVALMSGKNCYGVQCFSEELCTAVLAKKAPSSLMISHVTIKGEEGRCKIQRHFFSIASKVFNKMMQKCISLKQVVVQDATSY